MINDKLGYILLFFLAFSLNAQEKQEKTKKTKVYLEYAEVLSFDKLRMADAQILTGDVRFRHDSSYMYCDSAYFFQSSNSLEAFSNVRMEQGDTLFVYGDYLHYDGNTSLARLRENVRMENKTVTLFADSLNYDRKANLGYYFEGGYIVDEQNDLFSVYGKYSPETKYAVFNDSVRLENPNFVLDTDTLLYNTESKVATILGKSVIVSDSAIVHSSRGWYDTAAKKSYLLDRSTLVSGDRFLTGDSLFYNEGEKYGEAYGHMNLTDTARKVVLEGAYGYYHEQTGYAFATDSALFMEYSKSDTLFLHADSLLMTTTADSMRMLKAYYGVRFFRKDMQGVCDSLQFNTTDTVLHMYDNPILWNTRYQITGDTIAVYMKDSTIDYAHIHPYAFSIQEIDTSYYNQIKGQDMKAFFTGQTVNRVDVAGNVESLYFPIDDKDGEKIGMNEMKSAFLSMWIKNNKLDKLLVTGEPSATLYPIPDLTASQKTLDGFEWFDYLRPLHRWDIFRKTKRKTPTAPRKNNKFVY